MNAEPKRIYITEIEFDSICTSERFAPTNSKAYISMGSIREWIDNHPSKKSKDERILFLFEQLEIFLKA